MAGAADAAAGARMPAPTHYLSIVLEGVEYLLPSRASAAIEQRDAMHEAPGPGPVVAWRETRAGRWPAYGLDAHFRPVRPAAWQRAVFFAHGARPLGIVADDVRLLGRAEIEPAPFLPLGPAPTRFGHLFNGAWLEDERVLLVLDPQGVVGLLAALEESS